MIPLGGVVEKNKLVQDTIKRIEAGLKKYRKGDFDFILLSGGIFLPPKIQTIPGARLMAKYLVKKGISYHQIILEERSLDTFQNVKFSTSKLFLMGIKNPEITVITQWQHAIRFWICFRAYNLKISLEPINYQIPITDWLKEWLFILYHIYDRKGKKYLALKNREKRRQI